MIGPSVGIILRSHLPSIETDQFFYYLPFSYVVTGLVIVQVHPILQG